MFDITRSASLDRDDLDAPGDPGPTDRFATLDDLNVLAEAIMEHVIEHDRRQEARIDDLEATVVTLRQRVQQRALRPAPASPVPPPHRPPPTRSQQPTANSRELRSPR